MNLIHRIRPAISYLIKGKAQVNITPSIYYSSPNNALNGKRIIITGGGKGLGFSMAKKFTEEGAKVLIVGRNVAILEKSANQIGCEYLEFDVTHTGDFNEFINKSAEILGGIDCLVNNAGISLHESSFFDVSEETFDAQISTNF